TSLPLPGWTWSRAQELALSGASRETQKLLPTCRADPDAGIEVSQDNRRQLIEPLDPVQRCCRRAGIFLPTQDNRPTQPGQQRSHKLLFEVAFFRAPSSH